MHVAQKCTRFWDNDMHQNKPPPLTAFFDLRTSPPPGWSREARPTGGGYTSGSIARPGSNSLGVA
ncbi:MAG: hypothetical protein E5V65_14155 [Mesorhizobium sp.]|nr:MAG: hypothetical protein E5V65_14155 [Mesorhizobium sp.]